MKMLRMLINRSVCFSEEPNFLSNELRLVDWPKYPGQYFPSNFRGENLVVLRMHQSRLKAFSEVQNFLNMTILDFSSCEFLRKIPDVSRIPNLEELVLDYCEELVEVHHSVGLLNKLAVLRLRICSNLRRFPRSLKLISLEVLDLWGCSSLKNFLEIECQMEFLKDIDLGNTSIEQLNLRSCSKVVKFLKVEDNGQFVEESAISSGADLLQLLLLTNTSDSNGSCSSISFSKLRSLNLSKFPNSLPWALPTYSLNLSGSDIVTLPQWINRFVGIKILELKDCKQLREIKGLPPNVKQVYATGCVSLEIFLEEATRSQLFNMSDPPEPVESGTIFPALQSNCPFNSLQELDLSSSAVGKLPTWFNRFVGLKRLNLKDCKQLREIQGLPPNVEKVFASGCVSLQIFLEVATGSQLFNMLVPPEPVGSGTVFPALQSNCPFNSLSELDLSSSAVGRLPTWFNKFVGLKCLKLKDCKQLREILELPPNVESVDLSRSNIVTLPRCIESCVRLKTLYLHGCKQLREILRLPLYVVNVFAVGCVSLAIFLEEAKSSQSLNLGNNVPVKSDFLIQRDFPISLECLTLSGSAIVSFPACFNKFVRLGGLHLKGCKQLREIPKLPPSIEYVDLCRCTSLEKLQFNNLPMLRWIDLSDCPQHIRNDVQIDFFNERHLKKHRFGCIFPGNKIPDFFSHRKEVSNTRRCEIDINEPLHLDSKKTRIVLSAVIGTKTCTPNSHLEFARVQCSVKIKVIMSNGDSHGSKWPIKIPHQFHSDHLCLHYEVLEPFMLMVDNVRVKFELDEDSSLFFKSCGLHLEAVDLMDGVQLSKRRRDDGNLKSNCYPQQKKHCSTMGIRISDAEDMPLG